MISRRSLLVLSNCEDFEFLGSGYIIKKFTSELKKYYLVDYYDVRDYSLFSAFPGRASMLRYPLGKVLFLIRLVFFYRRKYDIIEFWGSDSFLAMGFARLFLKNTLLIHHSNGLESKYVPIMDSLDPKKSWYQFNYKRFFDLAIKLPHGIVTLTESESEWVFSNYGNKWTVGINPGIENDYLNLDLQIGEKQKLIAFVGTWLPKKGIDLIVSDLPLILRKYSEYKLLLIGVGHTDFILKDFPEDVRGNILVVPFIKEKKELREWYRKISILILPSKAESFGMVAAEGMACRCALVASKMGFAADLVDNNEVVFLDLDKKNDLFEKLDGLLNYGEKILRVADGGYLKVQNLNWNESGAKLFMQYEEWYKEKFC